MLTQDVPQWMQQSFIRSAQAAGATASTEDISTCYEKLVQLWSKSDRHHHDIRHLIDMLRRVDTLAPETPHADWVRLAAWFHGIVFSTSDLAVYTRNGGEDELASAKVAQEYLTNLGVTPDVVRAVSKLIVGLKKPHKVEEATKAGDGDDTRIEETSTIEMIDMDQLAIRDAHLGALAVEPQKYRHYLDDIQVEYAHIPFAHFLFARAQIVSKLLARKKLFYSPLATQWERPARDNLEAELERLKAKLEQLSAVPVAEKKHELDAGSGADSSAGADSSVGTDGGANVGDGGGVGASASISSAAGAHANASATSRASVHLNADDVAPEDLLHEESPQLAEELSAGAEVKTDEEQEREQQLADDTAALSDALASYGNIEEPRSSLEKLDDMFSPGPAPKKNLTPEQAEREARKKTAQQAWETIEGKYKA
ncbi:MAG: hypothetical protein PUK59_05775 [Actinomycetaceae bacterium]|nr:hypothetical protein [Actinomycetaceae bacterium]